LRPSKLGMQRHLYATHAQQFSLAHCIAPKYLSLPCRLLEFVTLMFERFWGGQSGLDPR